MGERRQVLGRVHRGVGAAVEHGLLDLLDEHALAADHVQRNVALPIPGGLDEHELDLAPARGAQGVGDRLRLGARLRAAAGGQADAH